MNVTQLYENLKNIGIPLIHVEKMNSSMDMDFPIEELDMYIKILEPKFLLVEILQPKNFLDFEEENCRSLKDVLKKDKKHIDEYLENNNIKKSILSEINTKTIDDIGMLVIGFSINGGILSISFSDDWMGILGSIFLFIEEKEKEEVERLNITGYMDRLRNEQEQKNQEREKIQQAKDNMIEQVEQLSESEIFKELKTVAERILFWEKNIPELYKTLTRSFIEKMARKYGAAMKNSTN